MKKELKEEESLRQTPTKNRLISDDDMLLSDFQDIESSVEKKQRQESARKKTIIEEQHESSIETGKATSPQPQNQLKIHA